MNESPTTDESTSDDASPPTEPARRRHTLRKVLLGLLACLVVLALALGGTAWYLQERLVGQVDRVEDAFSGLENRPAPAKGDGVNILVMGTDRRSDEPTTGDDAEAPAWLPGEQRTDSLMVLHVDADREGASIVSIPRDSWVTIPGYGQNKINAAFSIAGPSLAVATVEQLTDLRIDHIAIVDWDGFRELTDELGGVEVVVPETVHDSARNKTWEAGKHRMNGDEALLYVRQRYGLAGGDFDRIKRQQNFLRALMRQTLSSDTLASPTKAYGVLDAVTKHLTVDAEWTTGDMRGLLISLRSLRAADVAFTTAPVRGTGREGAQSVVRLDRDKGRELWGAVREDRADEWVEAHGAGLPASVS
ncbi:LytR family transcriptional regulator [Mumia zhuanghuii]|uniref:LCP family protein n=2 Tax=Mumia TaxID=1546255 RepID=A0ABW1QFE6_9ACTN|nr:MULTISPECIES: LCP family protein [Mumia]KAA1422776.1 LytR family transcriptional regulator [Mumia zhuanghuii]